MNQLLHNEPRQDENSICATLLAGAERELAALFSPVAELFGPAVVRMWRFRNLKGASRAGAKGLHPAQAAPDRAKFVPNRGKYTAKWLFLP